MSAVVAMMSSAYVLPGGAGLPPRQLAAREYHLPTRTAPIRAFDDGSQRETLELGGVKSMMWKQTENGLSIRDLTTPVDATTPVEDQIVSIHYSVSFVESGQVIESTGDRPVSFVVGEGSELLFEEAIAGMKVGGTRLVNLRPGTKYASPETDKTIQFEIELVGIRTGADALSFTLLRNRPNLFQTAILLTFVPDLLGLFGLLPAPDAATQYNTIFNSGGFGAVDILSSAVASAPIVADAANQWAAQGLQGLL